MFICARTDLHASLISVSQQAELLWVELLLNGSHTLKLGVIYKPNRGVEPLVSLLSDLTNFKIEQNPNQFIIIGGDLNVPHFNWKNPDRISNCEESKRVIDILDLGFTQLVTNATRVTATTSAILDVVLTNLPTNVSQVSVEDGISDHKAVLVHLDTCPRQREVPERKCYQYQKVTGQLLDNFMDDLLAGLPNFKTLCNSTDNIDLLYESFLETVKKITENLIPFRYTRSNSDPPWYNRRIRYLKKKMRAAHKKSKHSCNPDDYRAYSDLRRDLNMAKSQSEREFLASTLHDMQTSSQKRFWSYVKFKTKGKHNAIPTLHTTTGKSVTDAIGKANLLNSHFKSVFTANTNVPAKPLPKRTDKSFSLGDIVLSPHGISNLIKLMGPYKSPGPDLISPRLLKLAPDIFSEYLCALFKKCFLLKNIPSHWRTANITPIHKKGSRSVPANYRPISLTSIVSKLFEHLLTSNIACFLEANGLFNADQFGFRKGRSCELQLLRLCQDLSKILDDGGEADLIFLDFEKAFDKVPHGLLIHKLRQYGLNDNVVDLISSFLSNRTQRVVLEGQKSSDVHVSSGVPQGSVLGPLLFVLYINDLPDKIKSHIKLFADDSLIYKTILSPEDHEELQNDLNEAAQWCTDWLMSLNFHKCEHMKVSLKHNTLNMGYQMHNHALTQTQCYKYLGVHLNNTLNWNTHINNIVNKANKVLYVARQALYKSSKEVKQTAYKSLVRPLLEYSSSVWDPYTTTNIDAVEKVQRKAARFCCNNYNRHDSVTDMLHTLKWDSLAQRRKASRLATFHRIYHHDQEALLDLSALVQRAPIANLRNQNSFRVNSITCKKNVGHYSFIPRTIREWNSLSENLIARFPKGEYDAFRHGLLKGD